MSKQDLIPEVLRFHRKSAGLSQAGVARRANLSRSAYSKIESGKAIPRTSTLEAIASAIGTSVFALCHQEDAFVFGNLSEIPKAEGFLTKVAVWVRAHEEMERLFEEERDGNFQFLRSEVEGTEYSPGEAAGLARESLLDEGNHTNIWRVVEQSGISAMNFPFGSETASSFCIPGERPAIIVNTSVPPSTLVFSLCIQLGYLLLGIAKPGGIPKEDDCSRAKVFASRFLMPDKELEVQWAEYEGLLPFADKVLLMADTFKLPVSNVLYRLFVLQDKLDLDFNVQTEFDREYYFLKGGIFKEKKRVVNYPEIRYSSTTDPCLRKKLLRALRKEKIALHRASECLNCSPKELSTILHLH